jgi:predicted DNA-binding ribbon-helix-helix protein
VAKKIFTIRIEEKEYQEMREIAKRLGMDVAPLLRALWNRPLEVGKLIESEREKIISQQGSKGD